ncbi:putative F-box protein At1g32420 [Lycium barbarum]|uniref:putative F-box protein At1g32420 n=1 Tax=Lycium barbarum TaxID=112863 RepID=UPI00293EC61B|nr:putative F-box protein At1g32420 [Lycium barbarum]
MEEKHGFADDMEFEILTWLPAKSLMRFRCVSKAWNSLIRHNLNFIKLHNARSQARPPASRLLFEIQTCYRAVVESTSNLPTQLEGLSLQLARPRHYFNSTEITICSNHCNGLVCLYSHKDTQSYLYNITTGEIKALPFSLRLPEGWTPSFFLGFDPATKRYKLLHVVKCKKRTRIKILTLGTHSWRRLVCEKQYPFTSYSHTCTFLNGVLYWIELHKPITYFNFTEEKFRTIPFPQESYLNKMQSALWGKLAVNCRFAEKYNMVYDEVNKVFVEYNTNPDLENKKVALLAAENVDEKTYGNIVLATGSLNSASTSLVFPDRFRLIHVSSFVENIIPLTFIE